MKNIGNSKSALILIAGDLIAYLFALVLTLTIRYGEVPSSILLASHLPSFVFLFVIFLLVSFSAGLYEKQSTFVRGSMLGLLTKVQIINIAMGVAFFYFAPVSISPKANLFIYFIISTALLFIWRTVMFPVMSVTKNHIALIVGQGEDIEDIYEEVNKNSRYGIFVKEMIQPKANSQDTLEALKIAIKECGATVVIADLHDRNIEQGISGLYSLIFSGIQVIDASRLYESIFDRIPLSLVGERWLVENTGTALGGRFVYDSTKRILDILIAGILAIISLVFYPFVFVAIKLEDGGSVFISQERIGKNGKTIHMKKFRSMTSNDNGAYGKNGGVSKLRVTRVGKFIRLTRIDELPQLLSVIKGDQSLIGPRPELPALVSVYEKNIPYYNVRHLIKPGLSGWAQIYHQAHPHHAIAMNDTKDKLSYDLYYLKNRSIGLDIKIALQTAKAILSRQGV